MLKLSDPNFKKDLPKKPGIYIFYNEEKKELVMQSEKNVETLSFSSRKSTQKPLLIDSETVLGEPYMLMNMKSSTSSAIMEALEHEVPNIFVFLEMLEACGEQLWNVVIAQT